MASALQASSQGQMQRTDLKIWPYRFWGDTAQAAASTAELLRSKPYTPFYHIRADLHALAKRAKPASNNAKPCKQVVPQAAVTVGTYDASSEANANDPSRFVFCMPTNTSETDDTKWKPDTSKCIDFSKELPGLPILTSSPTAQTTTEQTGATAP